MLFIVQNVFDQQVYETVYYRISPPVIEKLAEMGVATDQLSDLQGETIAKAVDFRKKLHQNSQLNSEQVKKTIALAELYPMEITEEKIASLEQQSLSLEQIEALSQLQGKSFDYKWQLAESLAKQSSSWQLKQENTGNKAFNKKLLTQLSSIQNHFYLGSKGELPFAPTVK